MPGCRESASRIGGNCRAGGAGRRRDCVSWVGVLCACGWSGQNLFDLMPQAAVTADEPDADRKEFDQFWARVEGVHERSGVGNLVRPADLYSSPEDWWEELRPCAARILSI